MRYFTIASLLFLLALSPKNPAEVIRVVDGDTFKIIYYGADMTVRLIGIDTPESSPNAKAYRDAAKCKIPLWKEIESGIKASKYVKTLVKPGDKIYLVLDKDEVDRYNRILAYVYLKDGTFLNKKIIREGYALPMYVWPNKTYRWMFRIWYREAYEEGRGLWK